MPEKFVQIAQKKFSKTLDKSFEIVYNGYSEKDGSGRPPKTSGLS